MQKLRIFLLYIFSTLFLINYLNALDESSTRDFPISKTLFFGLATLNGKTQRLAVFLLSSASFSGSSKCFSEKEAF